MATISVVQSNSTVGVSSRSSISLASAPTQGNMLVVWVGAPVSVTPTTVTAGWSVIDSTSGGAGGNTIGSGLFYKFAGAAESSGPWNFRIAAASTAWACNVMELSGVDSTSPFAAGINGDAAVGGSTNITFLSFGAVAYANASTMTYGIAAATQRSSAATRENFNIHWSSQSTSAATTALTIRSLAGPIGTALYGGALAIHSTGSQFTGSCSGSVGVPSITGFTLLRASSASTVAPETVPHRLLLLGAGW